MYLCGEKNQYPRQHIHILCVPISPHALCLHYLDYCEKNRSIFGKESLISKVKNLISCVNLCTYVTMWWKKSIPASTYPHSLCSHLTTLWVCSTWIIVKWIEAFLEKNPWFLKSKTLFPLWTYVPMWWKKSIPASTYTHSLFCHLTTRSVYALSRSLWKE